MFGQQVAFQQPAYHAAPRNGPPPQKKIKGGMVITRYPAPPGYNGPPQQQHPAQGWPSAAPQTNGQPPYPGYQYPGYAPQGSYPVPQFGGWAPQLQPSPGFQPPYPPYHHPAPTAPSAPQSWHPPAASSFQQTPMQQQPMQWPALSNGVSTPLADPQMPRNNSTSHSRHSSVHQHSSVTSVHAQGEILDGNGDHMQSEAASALDDQSEFWEEPYFLRHPNEINHDLSLGTLHWTAPVPSMRTLPSTYADAEKEVDNPRPPLIDADGSVSEFFVLARRHEALVSVRETSDWAEVKDDLIFREFCLADKAHFLDREALATQYRDRPDPKWLIVDDDPESEYDWESDQDKMHVNGTSPRSNYSSRQHSRANSRTSHSSHRLLVQARSQRPSDLQEDILAALGVEGSPKPVIQPPGSSLGSLSRSPPLPSSRARASSRSDTRRLSTHETVVDEAFEPHPRSSSNPSWRTNGQQHSNGYSKSRRGSSASQHSIDRRDRDVIDQDATPRPKPGSRDARDQHKDRRGSCTSQHAVVSSDFQMEDDDATPRAARDRWDNRKRRYDEVEDDRHYDRHRQHRDEVTYQRNKLHRVDDAFK